MQSLADFPNATADLERRTRWYWIIGLGQVVATISLGLIVSLFSGLAASYLVLFAIAAYLPAYLTVSVWLMRFKCPRCNHRWFKLVGLVPPPFTTKCANCGLPRSQGMPQ